VQHAGAGEVSSRIMWVSSSLGNMRVKGLSKCKVPVRAERTQTSGHLDEHMGVSGDELQLCDVRWSLPHCHQRPCILNSAEDNEGPLHAEHNNDVLRASVGRIQTKNTQKTHVGY
jgi:hypothetical protein